MTTHSKPIGKTTQQIARSNPTGRLTRCDRRPTTRRPIVTAPAVDPETVQHPVRYTTATTKVTTVENTATVLPNYPGTPGARMTIGTAGK